MPIQERNKLKSWFETGDYPTQQQFWDLIDSFFHKQEDTITINNVTGLRDLLNAKADYELLQGHLANEANPHKVTKAQIGLGELPNAISSSTDENNTQVLATSAAIYQLKRMINAGAVEELTFTSNNSYRIILGSMLEKITVVSPVAQTLSIGTTAGGKDLLSDLLLEANAGNVIQLDVYAAQTDKMIFFSGITANTTIRFYKR
ncbi:hypothetical protein [Chitinophaga solisilvae]|uniref:hypothetical protein n=1 Tax=Chitinophaga solisilvae TaxID=1233460 RepID=UPI001369A848|nr:hypothetical protein [Chitinophaga solisilvae]